MIAWLKTNWLATVFITALIASPIVTHIDVHSQSAAAQPGQSSAVQCVASAPQ